MSVCLLIVLYCIVLGRDEWQAVGRNVDSCSVDGGNRGGGRILIDCLFVGGSYSCDGDGDGNGAVSDIFLWRWSGEEVVGGLKSKSGLGLGDCWLCRG